MKHILLIIMAYLGVALGVCSGADVGSSLNDTLLAHKKDAVVSRDEKHLVVESTFVGIPCQIGYYFTDGKVDEILFAFHVAGRSVKDMLGVYDNLVCKVLKGKPYAVDIKLFGTRLTRAFEVTTALQGDYIIGYGESRLSSYE
jgi:hypothetical protein